MRRDGSLTLTLTLAVILTLTLTVILATTLTLTRCAEMGVGSAFTISMIMAVWNLVLVVVILALIAHRALQQSNAPTLRCAGGKEPKLTLDAGKQYHTFLSHVWSTGQDQCAVIKRSIQHLLPTVSVFLDVDDLEEIGKLESYIDASASVLIFLSKGYFASRNCIREAKQTVAKR